MKNLVVGVLMVVGLAACSDSDGGGTGGAGGIQEPETTSGSTGGGDTSSSGDTTSSAGGGDGCAISADGTALCEAIDACEPGKGDDCAAELAEERCADTACLTVYDDWVACWLDLADADQIPECADFPEECDAERLVYNDCVAPDGCSEGPYIGEICAAQDDCDPGSFDACVEELQAERCLYPAGECRTKYDAWTACFAEVVADGDWLECPDYPDQCDAERNDYAASCI